MSSEYEVDLNRLRGIRLRVEFTTSHRVVIDYAVVLTAEVDGRIETIRVYDGAHGRNELHRFTQAAGKQPADVFHAGTLGEGFRAALRDCRGDYERMVEAWFR